MRIFEGAKHACDPTIRYPTINAGLYMSRVFPSKYMMVGAQVLVGGGHNVIRKLYDKFVLLLIRVY